MKAERPLDDGLRRICAGVDRASRVPLPVQLRGALEYGVGGGDLRPGTRLPSVRALAAALGLSPVTVSAVYARLREAGLIESRPGAGSFVARGDGAAARAEAARRLDRDVAALVAQAARLGVSRAELAFRVSLAEGGRGLTVLMLGLFPEATEDYAAALRDALPAGDRVVAATFDRLAAGAAPAADLVATPRNMVAEAARARPDLPAVGLAFIPNEATRVALAGLAPEARVCAVSFFPAFLALLRGGVARFAPHVRAVEGCTADDPALEARLAEADVLVHATGAEAARDRLPPGRAVIEYRHAPDPRAVRDDLLPALEARRAELQRDEEAPRENRREQLVRDRGLSDA